MHKMAYSNPLSSSKVYYHVTRYPHFCVIPWGDGCCSLWEPDPVSVCAVTLGRRPAPQTKYVWCTASCTPVHREVTTSITSSPSCATITAMGCTRAARKSPIVQVEAMTSRHHMSGSTGAITGTALN